MKEKLYKYDIVCQLRKEYQGEDYRSWSVKATIVAHDFREAYDKLSDADCGKIAYMHMLQKTKLEKQTDINMAKLLEKVSLKQFQDEPESSRYDGAEDSEEDEAMEVEEIKAVILEFMHGLIKTQKTA